MIAYVIILILLFGLAYYNTIETYTPTIAAIDETILINSSTMLNKLSSGQIDFPSGTVINYNGTTAPSGWALCDGSQVTLRNGIKMNTPDLRSRFIIGASSNNPVNSTGGVESIIINPNSLPSHSHGYTDSIWSDLNQSPQQNAYSPAKIYPYGSSQVPNPPMSNCGTKTLAGITYNISCAGGLIPTTATAGAPGAAGADTDNTPIYMMDKTFAPTGANATPVDIRPPYYAMIYIMRL